MCLGLFGPRGGDCNPLVFECHKGASPMIPFISGTDMTFDEGLLGMSGGVDFLFAAVWFLLLLFAIVPSSLLPTDYSPLSMLRVGGVCLGVGIYALQKGNTTKIGKVSGDSSG